MKLGNWLTLLLIVVYVVAGLLFAYDRDWGKLLYFMGAAILTLGVLMME